MKPSDKINQQVMPIVNDIKGKMDKLKEQYNFELNFAFPEITMEEIMGTDTKNPKN